MSMEWRYQIRVYLSQQTAAVMRSCPDDKTLQPLTELFDRHNATLVSQLDAFEAYVGEAERQGIENFPLYKWTKAAIEDPAKRATHATSFAVRIAGQEVYPASAADALEADLAPLAGGSLVTRMSRHDTNPANNMPVPPEYRG